MPRTALTLNTCDHLTGFSAGAAYVSFDQPNGHEVNNAAGDTVLIVKNTGAQKTLTVVSSQVIDTNLAVSDRTFTVEATTGEVHIAKFPTSIYNHTGNLLYVDIDSGTGVTILAIRYIS